MKRIISFFAIFIFILGVNAFAYEDTFVSLSVNGISQAPDGSVFIRDGITYADARALSEAMNYSFKEYSTHDSALINSGNLSVCITPETDYITVADLTGTSIYEYVFHKLSAPCLYANDKFYIPVRDFAKIFNYSLNFSQELLTVYLDRSQKTFTAAPVEDIIGEAQTEALFIFEGSQLPDGHAYFFQNQAEFALPNFGSGYCWACSYAMLLSNVTFSRITPADVAQINLRRTKSGAYCYHYDIISEYNVSFVSALPESSRYYGGRDMVSGGTFIKNPEKSDTVVIAALREALSLHPEGIMVRYAGYPHTMVAVGFDHDKIIFYDPAPTSSSEYSETGRYMGVGFEETCVGKKGFSLSDVTFIQAIK